MMRLSTWVLAGIAVAALLTNSSVDAQPEATRTSVLGSAPVNTNFLVAAGGTGVSQLDISLKPNYGEAKLKTGFLPDPHTVTVTAGGNLKVVHKGVTSHVTKAPDYKLYFQTNGNLPLTFFTESKGDTTLLINLPDGSWIVNDDGGQGLNSLIKINNPKSGRYDIYVGTFKPNLESKVKLHITELKPNIKPAPNTSVKQLDISLKPNYGEAKLKTGFLPDPRTVNVTAGGNLKVVYKGVTSYVTKQPDFKLYFDTNGNLPLTFFTESKGDTTLLINLPNGTWIANDDGGKGLNAQIKINNPKSGRYDIYVGTFRPNLQSKVKLQITELK